MKAAKSPTPAKNYGKSGANAKGLTKLNVSPRTGSFNCQTASNRDAHRLAHSTSIMNEVKIVYYPARPLLTSTLTFTRRFSARPDADSLLAMGLVLPIAPGATMCRTGMLQFSVR
jgi:hypothetical protein